MKGLTGRSPETNKKNLSPDMTPTVSHPDGSSPARSGALGRRHRRPPLAGTRLSNGELKRLARRGGVRRMGGDVTDEMRLALRMFLSGVIKDAVVLSEHSRRHTVYTSDVILALKRAGSSSWHTVLYGYDGPGTGRRHRGGHRSGNDQPAMTTDDASPELGADQVLAEVPTASP